ncbi:nuclear protein set [Chrysochromulina tobinii]|uniref:Nuclear protein set n=1 Tax=Chrysochromulina tobinii TaxID=1460289 RepID=A0A0M0JCC6_9EUKA|nr:nuclear protein set [Chrysochromulina tobinii]|eukprot:KOO24251.1 nuclear protein set [Chrysochromulina sp. CCMP291]
MLSDGSPMSDREFLAVHGVQEALAAAVSEILSTRPSNPILAIRDILIAKEAARALSEGLGEMGTDPNWQFKYSKRRNAYGMGIYAEEDIPAGSLVWRFELGVSASEYSTEECMQAKLATLSVEEATELLDHTYVRQGRIFNPHLDGPLINHSLEPNCSVRAGDSESGSYAIRDIKKGEEITENYNSYDAKKDWPRWYVNLMESHGIMDDYY